MTEPAIQALELKLDSVLAQLKATKDPALRRTLLTEMRGLIAELDRLVWNPPVPIPPNLTPNSQQTVGFANVRIQITIHATFGLRNAELHSNVEPRGE